ncbi:unnamed protein product, partial [marine sediment metagenome]
MIPQIQVLHTDLDWQTQLRDAIKSGRQLLDHLDLRSDDVGYSEEAAADFPVKVPMAFVHRMQRGDPRDPLLLQALSRELELLESP